MDIDGGSPDTSFRFAEEVVITSTSGEVTWGWVTGYDLPLTVADGDMRIDVGVAS